MSQYRPTRNYFDWNYALGNNNWATDINTYFTKVKIISTKKVNWDNWNHACLHNVQMKI